MSCGLFPFLTMSQETYFKIAENSQIELVTVTSRKITVRDDMLVRYMPTKPCKIKCMCMAATITGEADQRPVSLAVYDRAAYVNIPICVFPLNAMFRLEGDVMVPNFEGETDMQISLKWMVPNGVSMNVGLMVVIDLSAMHPTAQMLYAMDAAHRTWRLPTSNTYENGNLCTGSYDSQGESVIDVAIKAHRQFIDSQWQSDLSNRGGSNGMANAKKMFRFKPKNKEGFEQLPMNLLNQTQWTSLCTSFSNETLNMGMVL